MLRACLDSVKLQTFRDYEVIIVDNGSTDNSLGISSLGADPQCHLIRLNWNSGFSEANNMAFEQARGEFIILLNNDVVLDPGWLAAMVRAAAPDGIGSVACQLRQAREPELLDSVGFMMFFNGSADTFYGVRAEAFNHAAHVPYAAAASAALYKRKALDQLGVLFHNEYFAYYEDNDLAFRLRARGFDVAYASDAVGWHIGSATGKLKSDFYLSHLRRNIEYFFWINMSGRHLLRYGFLHILSEGIAFCELVLQGRVGLFIWAKMEFLCHLPWVYAERKVLFRKVDRKTQRESELFMKGFLEYMKHKIKNLQDRRRSK